MEGWLKMPAFFSSHPMRIISYSPPSTHHQDLTMKAAIFRSCRRVGRIWGRTTCWQDDQRTFYPPSSFHPCDPTLHRIRSRSIRLHHPCDG